jgi:phosphomannomutase
VRDYLQLKTSHFENGRAIDSAPLDGPKGDLVILDLASDGDYIACRPSGTEPKIKFYLFAYTPPEQIADLARTKSELWERVTRMEGDLRKFAGV